MRSPSRGGTPPSLPLNALLQSTLMSPQMQVLPFGLVFRWRVCYCGGVRLIHALGNTSLRRNYLQSSSSFGPSWPLRLLLPHAMRLHERRCHSRPRKLNGVFTKQAFAPALMQNRTSFWVMPTLAMGSFPTVPVSPRCQNQSF